VYRASFFCGIGISILLTCAASGQDDSQQVNIQLQRDVVYGKGGDIAIPSPVTAPVPCIVVIHGGAWRQGDKKMHEAEIRRFAAQGYVSASLQYRLCPTHQFPAQVEDVKCAVRYLRAHAGQYGIDPARIGAVGFSAGAHLAMMLGTMDSADGLEGNGGWQDQSSKVQAVVAFFGPTEMGADDIPAISIPLLTDFLGGSRADKPDAYKLSSPITYVSKGDAPMLLLQGTEDPLVPYSQAVKMVTAMTKADVPGRVEFMIDAGHGWGGAQLERTIKVTNEFFKEHLR
jgi:acetyl esterase/lipase